MTWNEFYKHENFQLIAASAIVFFLFYFIKHVLEYKVKKRIGYSNLDQLKLKRDINTYWKILFIFALSIIWFSHLQNFVVSMLAFVAAIVLATKELIMSFTGGFLIRLNNHFKLGDRIEVDGIRGFVIEKNFSTTKILEIGPEKHSQQTTGDMITIPNSTMLTKSVKNESYFRDYTMKSFTFKAPANYSITVFEKQLNSWADEICKGYIDEAKELIETFCRKESLLIPAVHPRTKIMLNDKGEISLLLKMPVKNMLVGDIEQALFRKYVSFFEAECSPK